MDDLISRQAALEAVKHAEPGTEYEAIEALPTIEERKTGRWVEVSDDVFASTFYCSVCREEPPIYGCKYELTRFCPNCGADMRGEEHETN